MIAKMGSRKYVLPVLVAVLVSCVMALIFYPIIKASPRELPFAVLSLDQGAETPQGDLNMGQMIAAQLVDGAGSAGGAATPIKWQPVESREQLDQALADNDYFGALIVPAGFTQGQVLAQTGQGDAVAVDVVLDNAKSPIVASQMQALIGGMFEQMDIPVQVQVIHTGEVSASAASPLAGMMSQQIGVMPLMIMSVVGAVLLSRIFDKKGAASPGARLVVLGKQVAYAAGLSLLISLAAVTLLNGLVGAGAPFWTTTVFLWFASFVVTLLFLGAFDVSIALGGFAVVVVLFCGMMTAVLPPEMLPTFWAEWIAPWAPQAFIGQGLRDILYMGAGLMPRGSGGLLALGGAGLALVAVSALFPIRKLEQSGTAASRTESAPVMV